MESYKFQEQRTSQLPLELDQLGDDSASMRSDADVQSKYDLYYIQCRLGNDENYYKLCLYFFFQFLKRKILLHHLCQRKKKKIINEKLTGMVKRRIETRNYVKQNQKTTYLSLLRKNKYISF